MDAAKLKSEINVACVGVITVVELLVTFRNLYIQYCEKNDGNNVEMGGIHSTTMT